jgi:hypothetical protein
MQVVRSVRKWEALHVTFRSQAAHAPEAVIEMLSKVPWVVRIAKIPDDNETGVGLVLKESYPPTDRSWRRQVQDKRAKTGAGGDLVVKHGVCGNATLWDSSRVTIAGSFPSSTMGNRLKHHTKCCVATLVKSDLLSTYTWVVNVHLVHNDQSERKTQLKKVLDWLNDRLARDAVLLCGDFNANYMGTVITAS